MLRGNEHRGVALAVVLARGGSKGLPRKNALSVGGRPCLEWTLMHAFAAETVGAVVLSTDDAELMGIGRAWGARTGQRVEIVERSAELAADGATVDAAAREAIGQRGRPEFTEHRREDVSAARVIVILYGNVPVRPAGLIDRAVQKMIETGADSVQSYAPVGKFHPWWMARVDSERGAVRPWEGEVLNRGVFRRQDLPPAYVPDGGVIVVTREALMLEIAGVAPGPHAFFGREDRRRGVLNGEGDVVDIDSRMDMMVADVILKELAGKEEGSEAGKHRGIE